jgi:hypothetical protein
MSYRRMVQAEAELRKQLDALFECAKKLVRLSVSKRSWTFQRRLNGAKRVWL